MAGENRNQSGVGEASEKRGPKIAHGASPNAAGMDGRTAARSAREVLRPPAVAALVDYASDADALEIAAQDVGAMAGAIHPSFHHGDRTLVVVRNVFAELVVAEAGAPERPFPALVREAALRRHGGGSGGGDAREIRVVSERAEPGAPADVVDESHDGVDVRRRARMRDETIRHGRIGARAAGRAPGRGACEREHEPPQRRSSRPARFSLHGSDALSSSADAAASVAGISSAAAPRKISAVPFAETRTRAY